MASEKFNVLNGLSVGIPPVSVLDGNGNVVSNFNNLSGNVSANRVFANSYFYSNGQSYVGGSNSTVLFNNNGTIDGTGNLVYNISTNTLTTPNITVAGVTDLGVVGNLRISGGSNNQILSTDGNNNVIWRNTIPSYNISQLPSASSSAGAISFITDGLRPNRPVYSDGINWRFISDDAVLI